jgi:hypothetical protein
MKRHHLAIAAAFWAAACTCNKSEQTAASAEPPKAEPRAAATFAIPSAPPAEVAPSSWPMPSGLRLAVLAGKGVGPIRFGATVATIERLMDLPCEVRTEDSCRYIARAIDFVLKDGVAVEMHLHRVNRAATPDGRTYGVFNGRTPEGVAFMMLPTGVDELLGKPTKSEPAKDPGQWGTVEIREYPGMRLEFDRLPTGKVVLGGIVLYKADVPDKPIR